MEMIFPLESSLNMIDLSRTPLAKIWAKIKTTDHHGINVPLLSIHTKNSCGCGEIYDLIPLIKYLQEVGFDTIQLLPLNDSGFDPSPYNALSSLAINPIYLSLSNLPNIDSPDLQKQIRSLQKLTKLKRVPYQKIYRKKIAFLRNLFQKAPDLLHSSEFLTFIKDNSWLTNYAIFKVIKEKYPNQMPSDLMEPSKTILKKLATINEKEILFHSFVQYLLFTQLSLVKQIAEKHHVLIKGDIPILISQDSVEVWTEKYLFDTHFEAGAPADMFKTKAQVWGFPIFNWKAIQEDNYNFWKRRLSIASNFYHIYRIDHVIGFFRIFAIPRGKNATMGYFIPRDPKAIIPFGKYHLEQLISFSNMLPIAEDLGSVPDGMQDCLESLGICGTRVFRWEKDRTKENLPFIMPSEYTPISMTSLSTHDSQTLTEYFKKHWVDAEKYVKLQGFKFSKKLNSHLRKQLLIQSHLTPSIFHINLLQEYLAMFKELTWKNPKDDRINVPGKVLPRNWVYRYKRNVETITAHKELKKLFLEIKSCSCNKPR